MTPEAIIMEAMLTIVNKDREEVPFKLNTVQRLLDENLTGRDIVPKARQYGISSYALGRNTVKCLTQRNTRSVIISHESDATQRMLEKVHFFLQRMRPSPKIGRDSQNAITFPKTNSSFYIGTAGSRSFGRGDTITNLHCSEVAFWPEPKTLMTGLLQAVPRSGEIMVESTGNGQGNYYHRRVLSAAEGLGRYKMHFFGWLDTEEYEAPVTPEEAIEIMENLDYDLDEPRLVSLYGLDAGRIKFRREKLEELEYDVRLFSQEYPITLEECFQASGRGIFAKLNYQPTNDWQQMSYKLSGLASHPRMGRQYLLGSDIGGGVGEDNSTIEVFDLETLEQVAEYACNDEDPVEFASTIRAIGEHYNWAFVTVEANNYGISTLDNLFNGKEDTKYPSHLLYYEEKRTPKGATEVQSLMNLGFRTTHISKPFIIGKLRTNLARDMVIHSEKLRDELYAYVEDENGKLGAQDGMKDDRVMGCAMVSVALQKGTVSLESANYKPKIITPPSPFSLEGVLKEFKDRNRRFPISPQGLLRFDH